MKEFTKMYFDGILSAFDENCIYEKTFNIAVSTNREDGLAGDKLKKLKKNHPKGDWCIQSKLCNESTIKFTARKYHCFDEIDIGVLFEKLLKKEKQS